MRPLHRPMFRYGGPIKEGIMSGIREPKRDGNIVGGRQSPKLAGAHPLKDASGREHHLLPAGMAIGAGLQALRIGAQRAIPKIANFFRTQVGTRGPGTVKVPGAPGTSGRFLPQNVKTVQKSGPTQPIYEPNFLGRDPTVRLVGGTYKAITNPKVAGIAGKTARLVFSPTGLVAGAIYAGGKFFDSDGNEIENAEEKGLVAGDRVGTSGAPGGGDPGMYLTPQAKGGEGTTLSKEELRKKRVERYRDIMDIKGMNKDAAYDSLIAASKAIGESGDFKGDLKSGKLINQIIQSTSKAFDKPKQTKDAIDTLILKGEIEKDIKASDPSNKIANELNLARIDKLKKELNPSFNTLKAGFAKDNKGQSGIDLAAGTYAANNGIDFKGNIISKSEFNDILKDLKAKTKGLDEDLIIKNYTEEIIKTQEAPDGAYTVGDKIVIIQDKQVIAVE